MKEEKGKTDISTISPEKRPPRFEDYLWPNPFERPWMLPYLPSDRKLRDFIIMIVGSVLSALVLILLDAVGAPEFITVGIGLGGAAIFQTDVFFRHVLAGSRLGSAKRNGRL